MDFTSREPRLYLATAAYFLNEVLSLSEYSLVFRVSEKSEVGET